VKPFRDRYDPSAAQGVPAHITLLYPFKPPAEIDGATLDTLRKCFEGTSPIRFSLVEPRRFPGVLYLAPAPDDPFRQLTLTLWRRFPETPPYGGKHSTVIPHLSIACIEDSAQLDRIAIEFRQAACLPIVAVATEAVLLDNVSGRWERRSGFALGFD
jgi:hypothetical protein